MSYNAYKSRLFRSKWLAVCGECKDNVVRRPTDYLNHQFMNHGLKKKTTCPWCRKTFTIQGVNRNLKHLDHCFTCAQKEGLEPQQDYERYLNSITDSFQCNDCSETFTAKQYEAHVYKNHGVVWGAECPWCRGPAPSGPEHWEHCLNAKRNLQQTPPTFKPQSNVWHLCDSCASFDSDSKRRLFSNTKRIANVHPFLYESFGEEKFRNSDWYCNDETPSFVAFDESSGLGFDAPSFLRKFAHVYFFHVAVKFYAFESFYEAFRDSPNVGLLPYWCLCKGGSNKNKPNLYTHHRHGIAVCASKRDFLDAFHQVKRSSNSKHAVGQQCRCYWPIQSLSHLCSVICYLSNTKSRCTGKGFRRKSQDWTTELMDPKRDAHYYINRPVIPHGLYYLYMSFKGGIDLYLNRRHGKRNVYDMPTLLKGKNKLFSVTMSNLPKDKEPTGCFPPLANDLDYSSTSDGFIGLWKPNGVPIYLKRTSPRVGVSRETFMIHHVSQGRGFGEQLDSCRWTLTLQQQRYAKHVLETENKFCDKMKWQKDEQRLERKRWDKQNEELRKQNEDLMKRNEELLKQIEEKDREIYVQKIIQDLKDKHAQEIKELKEEIAKLKDDHNQQILNLKDDHNQQILNLKDDHNRQILDLKDESNRQIIKLKDEIRDTLKEQFKSAVREMQDKKILHRKIQRILEERYQEALKTIQQQTELKDQIFHIFRWFVGEPQPRKRKQSDCIENLKKRKD